MVKLYNDSNYKELLPESGNVFDFEGPRILNAEPPWEEPGEVLVAPAADFKLIPRSEWPDRIREKDANKSWLEDIVRGKVPCSDQNGLGYCHAYGTVMKAMVLRQMQNLPYIELSAESVGGPVTGWQNRSAWPSADMAQIAKYGACPASYMDRPHSLDPRRWKAGWQQAALDHRVTEWRDLRVGGPAFDMAVTACLLNLPAACGYRWWGHYVSGAYRVLDLGRGKYAVRIRNNWGPRWGDNGFADFQEGKGTPDWAFACWNIIPTEEVSNARLPDRSVARVACAPSVPVPRGLLACAA